ncbi:MAG: mechanosensitive ion channel family protein, partial [Muribaculum sp.]|nr:mechanosensitive ion channel family protein [Muribaculum sp.]
MKRIIVYIFLLAGLLMPGRAYSQLFKKAEQLLQTAVNEVRADSVSSDMSTYDRNCQDSIRLQEMTLQLQEMKLQEILLRTELDSIKAKNTYEDSLKKAVKRRQIDSLRAVTSGVPVVVDEDTLFTLYADRGGYSAFDRAEMTVDILLKIGKDARLRRDTVRILENDGYTDIMYGNKVIVSVTDQDAMWEGVSRKEL